MCPVECEDGYNANRREMCESCPLRDLDEVFENETQEIWTAWGVWKWKFKDVLPFVYRAIRYKDSDRISVYTGAIVNVYESEYNLHRDTKDFEREQARKAAEK